MSTAPDPKTARERQRLTQEALAHKAGCSVATVVRCERLGRFPTVRAIRRAYLRACALSERDVQP